ncbi:unnamed protein product, partial [Aphanomyces euteiches]
MGGQNSKQEVPVNNVGNMSNQGTGKRKIGSVLANQNKRHDGGQGKANARLTPKGMRCFYCDGKYNVGAQDHPKWKCPKRQEDFSQGWTRSNMYEKPRKMEDSTPRGRDAMRQEVPCGAVTTREEEPLPPMADSRREIELPDDESTKSIEDILFDDEVEEDMMQFSPALVADTTATPTMETVAASMKSLSVELDQ